MERDLNAELAKYGGNPKPTKKQKSPKKELNSKSQLSKGEGLKRKTKLKSKHNPIPLEVKKAVLEEKGSLCFLGHCPICGGMARVTVKDDAHHFPHRSQGGKDIVEHLWPCRRDCHRAIHDAPWMERLMFQEMETAGISVVWKVAVKEQLPDVRKKVVDNS